MPSGERFLVDLVVSNLYLLDMLSSLAKMKIPLTVICIRSNLWAEGGAVSQVSLRRDLSTEERLPTMKPNSAIQNTLAITFIAVVLIAVSAFATGYAGDVRLNIGADGIQFEMDSN